MVVMEHTENLYNSLSRYFNVLETVGYYKSDAVNGLLMYLFITEAVLDGPLSAYLDDEGMQAFNNVLRCLHNSGCLVRYIGTEKISRPKNAELWPVFRKSEICQMRITQKDDQRTTEQW